MPKHRIWIEVCASDDGKECYTWECPCGLFGAKLGAVCFLRNATGEPIQRLSLPSHNAPAYATTKACRRRISKSEGGSK